MKLQVVTALDVYYYLSLFLFVGIFIYTKDGSVRSIDELARRYPSRGDLNTKNCTRRKCKVLLAIVKVYLRGQSSKAYVHPALRVSSNLNYRAKG